MYCISDSVVDAKTRKVKMIKTHNILKKGRVLLILHIQSPTFWHHHVDLSWECRVKMLL